MIESALGLAVRAHIVETALGRGFTRALFHSVRIMLR